MPSIELPLSELRPDAPLQVEHADTKLVVVRANGGVFAFHDRCPHAFWPLSLGTLRDTVLECPGHGWEFDVESGQCLTAPGYCLSRVAATVTSDTVRLEWADDAT